MSSQSSSAMTSKPQHPLEEEAWKSTYVLSNSSQQEFRVLRSDTCEGLSVIDDEIARVQAILDKLREQRTCLVSRIARIDSAIAPYKKLSPELLADIFFYCIDPPLYLPPGTSDAGSSKIALSLELVCSLWRQVAVGTRKLWDNISVHYRYNREKNWLLKSDRVTAFAHGILSRGTRRITVFMFPIGLPIARNPIGELLFPFSQQLSHIRINCSFSVLRPFLESPPGSFDALQSFALDVHRLDSIAVHPPQQITVFGRNPNLSELDLQFDNVRGLSRLFRSTSGLLWSRLKRLSFRDTVTGVSFTTAHSILSLCTSLIHCSFDLLNESILSVTATTSQATGSIIHDCLETLVLVSGSGGGNVTQFLKKLTLPSLKIFDISSSDGNWLPIFAALVTRSGCSLSSLTLRYASLSEGELEPLLTSVSPTLEYLSFHATQLPDSMLERITQGFLPRLKSLMCTIGSAPRTLEYFMEMVRSRWVGQPSGSLSDVYAHYYSDGREGLFYEVPEWKEAYVKFRALAKELQTEDSYLWLQTYKEKESGFL